MKKFLILTYRYPFKIGPHCSSGQNIFYEALKSQFIVKGICFGDKEAGDEDFISVKRSANIFKGIFNLLFKIPIRLTYYQSRTFQKILENMLLTFKPDVIYVEHSVMMQYTKYKNIGAKIVFYDDESIVYVREHKLMITNKEKIKNIFMRRIERKAIAESDVVFTITEQEKNYLKKIIINNNIESLPYGIDTNYFYPNWKPDESKLKILFLGNYEHYPNKEAVKFISKEISTQFLNDKRIEFVLVGRNTKNIKKYVGANFQVYENVSDVRQLYWTSTIFVAPIFYGGGLRTKILEAASCGIPIVMSSLSNNGFGFKDRKEVLIANTAKDYIEIVRYIKSSDHLDLLKELSNNARQKIINEFSREVVGENLKYYINKYI